MYRVEITRRAQRELDRLPRRDYERVRDAIRRLGEEPRRRGVRKIEGPIHRIRVGPYRVIYAVLDEEELIVVVKVARRAEDTYDDVEELL